MVDRSSSSLDLRGPRPAWPLVVVGAGAAGLTAALFAGRAGVATLALETRPRPGAKIRVSGGGRCNVLPVSSTPDDFETSGSRPALRNLLGTWPLAEIREFFESDLGIALVDEPGGKVFPRSGSAREVVDALLRTVRSAGVRVAGDARVVTLEVTPAAAAGEGGFRLGLEDGRRLRARRVVLATGGRSLPKTGSDGGGLRLASALGHRVVPTRPALVPLIDPTGSWAGLSGLTVPAELTVRRGDRVVDERRGSFLFTHRGYSGPVVLDVSRHFTGEDAGDTVLTARWGDGTVADWDRALRESGGGTVASRLRGGLPRRLVDRLLERAAVDGTKRAAELGREDRRRLGKWLEAAPLVVGGHEGWNKAEVTAGGVPLAEVRGRDLESRIVPGLHLAGEILDVTGRLGGFNFQWAWVTGRRAGEGAAAALRRAAAAAILRDEEASGGGRPSPDSPTDSSRPDGP
jgi:predicted Rossmann fold flavoprotein